MKLQPVRGVSVYCDTERGLASPVVGGTHSNARSLASLAGIESRERSAFWHAVPIEAVDEAVRYQRCILTAPRGWPIAPPRRTAELVEDAAARRWTRNLLRKVRKGRRAKAGK